MSSTPAFRRAVAQALLDYPRDNHVNVNVNVNVIVIVIGIGIGIGIGIATHGVALQRFVHSVLVKVAMEAPSTYILLKAEVPAA